MPRNNTGHRTTYALSFILALTRAKKYFVFTGGISTRRYFYRRSTQSTGNFYSLCSSKLSTTFYSTKVILICNESNIFSELLSAARADYLNTFSSVPCAIPYIYYFSIFHITIKQTGGSIATTSRIKPKRNDGAEETRTLNLLNANQTLWPIELQPRCSNNIRYIKN